MQSPPSRPFLRAAPSALLMVGLAALAGCASLALPTPGTLQAPVEAADRAWSERQKVLSALERFQLTGRAALQSGDKGWSAQLEWVQGPSAFTMELVGPLNQGTVRIAGDAAGVMVESAGETASAPSLEALIGDSLGWRVPIEALRWWVLGLPAPDWPAEDLRLDGAGRLTDVRQGPWRLSVLAYVDASPLALPRKLYVDGESAELRLVIARWGNTE